uniref:Protein C14orf111 n=1 Tax=Rhizophora mucronata TaxID=61149 RepID=A0A2P2LNU9_RHIMU
MFVFSFLEEDNLFLLFYCPYVLCETVFSLLYCYSLRICLILCDNNSVTESMTILELTHCIYGNSISATLLQHVIEI